jgi:hypothetical protein
MRSAIAAAIVFACSGAPAQAQEMWAKIPAVRVFRCPEGVGKCGPNEVRGVPWTLKAYRHDIGELADGEETYLPLSDAETASLTALRDALLAKPGAKPSGSGNPGAFQDIKVEYESLTGHIWNYADSSFDKLHALAAAECTAGEIHSLNTADDKTERYGLLRFDCASKSDQTPWAIGVAMQAAKPVRLYFGDPTYIYGKVPAKP